MVTKLAKRFNKTEMLFLLFVLLVFLLSFGKNTFPFIKQKYEAYITNKKEETKLANLFNLSCTPEKIKIKVTDGEICRDKVDEDAWVKIYDSYPISAKGKDTIFNFLNISDLEVADNYLKNIQSVDRFQPVVINPPIQWNEDPYKQPYWRFIFYSLRPVTNLVSTYKETADPAYKNKLIEIMESFVDTGMSQPLSWDDNHAVAFRAMVLTNVWWGLRETHSLPVGLSTKLLKAIKVHGDFLMDRTHYEPSYNHGINEAAALLLLSENFPDIDGASEWNKVARDRLFNGINDGVDENGILAENSPYYHFYSLEKYWEIQKYLKKYNIDTPVEFNTKIEQMIDYATYIPEPSLDVPLLGASLKRSLVLKGVEKEIAQTHPNFAYVLTKGLSGKMPSKLSVNYAVGGETILRSGWEKGETFTKQTQLIFDIGPYRTLHSHYDALSFSLFGNGRSLMPDSGLYTYDDGKFKNYFRGTYAHNTVVVDGKDQLQGTPIAGTFIQGNGYSYQSAEHSLYEGVSHERAVTLLGDKYILIIDKLNSDTVHNYEQLFHLFPGAKIQQNGLDIIGLDETNQEQVTIHQIQVNNISVSNVINDMETPRGICSEEYGKAVPCYSISYLQKGSNVEYITLLEIGKKSKDLKITVSPDSKSLEIRDEVNTYNINVAISQKQARKIEVKNNNMSIETNAQLIPDFLDVSKWSYITQNPLADGKFFPSTYQEKSLALTSSGTGSWVGIEKNTNLDLSDKNLLLRMHIDNAAVVNSLELTLMTGNSCYATTLLMNDYRPEYANEWRSISIGKGMLRKTGGQWTVHGSCFSWSNITKVKFRMSTILGNTATLRVSNLATTPEQKEGNAIIVFDDGYASITPAAVIMHDNGVKGNVAAISSSVNNKSRGRLSLAELKNLQDNYGWNILNHSWYHKNAINTYYDSKDLQALEEDILKGIEFLTENGINTNQNWYIYPNGEYNNDISAIISKYYKFARGTQNSPEVFPFGNNYGVKVYSVQNNTPVQDVIDAVADAKKYKLTLFLTFHRIQQFPTDKPGYDINNFKQIIEAIKASGINVVTLSELDALNGISKNEVLITKEVPEQINLSITKHTPFKLF